MPFEMTDRRTAVIAIIDRFESSPSDFIRFSRNGVEYDIPIFDKVIRVSF